jgi:putative tricarboxylic transport membrane protein
MSQHAQDGSLEQDPPRPKGEFKMMALLFVICGALFVDSLRSPGLFQGESAGPGSIPQLVTGALLLMIIGLAMQFLKRRYKEGTFGELIHHLFDKEVVILLVMLMLYGLVLETIHFVPATFLFLVGTMYLLDRSKPVLKVVVSAVTLAGLYLIFSTLFQVVLP